MEFSVRIAPALRSLALTIGLGSLAACASSGGANLSTVAPNPDPRVGLRAGLMNAAEATWNLRVVSKTPPPEQFAGMTNSDLAFTGQYAIQGNYNGFQVWDSSNPNSALFRIEVIKVPLAHPEQAAIVSSPRIFSGLTAPPKHGETPEDIAAAAKEAADWRAKGGFTAKVGEIEYVLPAEWSKPMLDSVVKARGGSGAPTAADSATTRGAIQKMVDAMVAAPAPAANGVRPGPNQCHDITVYPAFGLAGGACGGYGLLLDIRDVANPKRMDAVSDSNFSYWHSATFNNDGTKLLFSDEWGGGGQPKCRATDKHEWGADAIFTLVDNRLTFQSYYKMSAPQTPFENCVAHNGSLIPIPGRDVMVQAWYQGGICVFDWTDPAHPKEIAFFDRGPVDSTKMEDGGSWSAYWYNGVIVSSEIARGLDIFELKPSGFISQNEIDEAKLVHREDFHTEDQPKFLA